MVTQDFILSTQDLLTVSLLKTAVVYLLLVYEPTSKRKYSVSGGTAGRVIMNCSVGRRTGKTLFFIHMKQLKLSNSSGISFRRYLHLFHLPELILLHLSLPSLLYMAFATLYDV